jgi:hypothetical protein
MEVMTLDAALAAVYVEFDVPADRFIANADLAEAFAAAVRERVGDLALETQVVLHRLLYLRKRAHLPRLRRSYFGRNFSDN